MTAEHSLSATPNNDTSRPSSKRFCNKCQRESQREDGVCPECDVDLAVLSPPSLLISATLTAAPFIIAPTLSILSVSETDASYSFGFAYIGVILICTILLAGYAIGAAFLGALVRPQSRAVARGILVGLGIGPVLGVVSCTAFLVTS